MEAWEKELAIRSFSATRLNFLGDNLRVQNTPTSQPSVQSKDLEVTHIGNNSEARPGASRLAKDSLPHVQNAGEGETSGETSAKNSQNGSQNCDESRNGEKPINKPKEEKPKVSEETKTKDSEKIPKSIRLSQTAFNALKGLMGKYDENMADMVSIAILAYAKNAAAAPILRYRLLDENMLFLIQASATDIRSGLCNLRGDLRSARKSHSDPIQLQEFYADMSDKYQSILKHADEVITLIDKEMLLDALLEPSDFDMLRQEVLRIENSKPNTISERKLRELLLRIYQTLLP
jgi:hypothetical protein